MFINTALLNWNRKCSGLIVSIKENEKIQYIGGLHSYVRDDQILIVQKHEEIESVRIILITYYSTIVPHTSCVFSCWPFVVNATFSTGLVRVL